MKALASARARVGRDLNPALSGASRQFGVRLQDHGRLPEGGLGQDLGASFRADEVGNSSLSAGVTGDSFLDAQFPDTLADVFFGAPGPQVS